MTTTTTKTRTENFAQHRLREDVWVDEIRLVCEGGSLRLVTRSRWKSSGLTGSEWRAYTMWQAQGLPIIGDDTFEEDDWTSFDGPFGYRAETGCAALYPGLHSSQPHLHGVSCLRIEFRRKGRLLYQTTDKPAPLLTVAGHLSWALVTASDEPLGTTEAWQDHAELCNQPGCCAPAVVRYQLRKRYTRDGVHELPAEDYALTGPIRKIPLVVQFCAAHRNRGDQDKEDCMTNYIELDI